MKAIFLSASVPVEGRGNYYETADPFLIQFAVRELMTATLGRRLIVWGGHPAITPMVWAVCEDLGVDYASAVVLYQSNFFAGHFPEENQKFDNVEYISAVPNDKDASLLQMREAMLSRADLTAAVFIGGMEGVIDEYNLFRQFHPEDTVVAVSSPGGAAQQLFKSQGHVNAEDIQNIDFAKIFHDRLGISPDEPRNTYSTT